jgi:phosphatidate phosphatase APP1
MRQSSMNFTHKAALLCICIILGGGALRAMNTSNLELDYSEIAADEVVVFFRTTAWLDEAEAEWHVPIHGWIYEPQDSSVRKALFASVAKREFDLTPDAATEANFSRRVNLLIADNERDKLIVVSIAGDTYTLPASAKNGHFETTIVIPATKAEKYVENASMSFSAVSRKSDSREFIGEVIFIPPNGLSIISDIDDTVKISDVTERKMLLENTFFLDFAAAPGMAPLYNAWSKQGAMFHFVSSSPWQLYEPLREFLDDADFPAAGINLKAVRFRDETLFDLFKKGTETKPGIIEDILETYPDRKFVLVGDSGEQDPEVYAGLIQKYPDQVLKIYIRNVTEESADNDRFTAVFEDIDASDWTLFEDPLTLQLPEASKSGSPHLQTAARSPAAD